MSRFSEVTWGDFWRAFKIARQKRRILKLGEKIGNEIAIMINDRNIKAASKCADGCIKILNSVSDIKF